LGPCKELTRVETLFASAARLDSVWQRLLGGLAIASLNMAGARRSLTTPLLLVLFALTGSLTAGCTSRADGVGEHGEISHFISIKQFVPMRGQGEEKQ